MDVGELEEKLPWAIALALAALLAIVKWFGARDVKRYDDSIEDNTKRIRDIERTMVTRDELSTVVGSILSERREMHQENKRALQDILATIKENEQRDANTRHDIRDEMQMLTTQVAVIAQSHGIEMPATKRRRD